MAMVMSMVALIRMGVKAGANQASFPALKRFLLAMLVGTLMSTALGHFPRHCA